MSRDFDKPRRPGDTGQGGLKSRPARPGFNRGQGAPGGNRPGFKKDAPAPGAEGRPSRPAFNRGQGAPGGNRPGFKSDSSGPRAEGKPERPAFNRGQGAPGGNRPGFKSDSSGPRAEGKPERPAFNRGQGAPGGNRPGFKKDSSAPGARRGFKPGANNRKDAPAGDKPSKPLGADARRIALDALLDVAASGAYSTLSLDGHLRKSRIDPQDKRLATMIFYTALENRLKIDYALKQFVEKMPDQKVECILHIAAAQLLLMNKIPDYAAVDAAVNQTRALEREPYVGLVNGSLRTLIRARDAGEIKWPDRSNPLHYLSVMHSLPEALAAKLIDDYGLEEAERIIAYRPELRTETVRPNLTQMSPESFESYGREKGWAIDKGVAPVAFRLTRPGDLTGDPDYKAGLFSVQGEGSMLAALALEPRRAGNYLDACAAPGGKSALIAEIMQLTGRVQSWDVHAHRVELIQATKKRLRLDNLRPAQRDAAVRREDLDAAFDGVLIDAPCSGLGVMHDKPDIKYRVSEADLVSLPELQKRILDACAPYVAPGGLLVYATCTILKDENERQVRDFLRRHPEFEPETGTAYLPEPLRPLAMDGMAQLQAYQWDAEGFFIARMRRKKP